MVQTKPLLTRATAIASAVALVSAALVPALFYARANAGLPTSRSITLSTSAAAATDVTYSVAFTTATTSNIGGIVIDFCDSSPIIGDSSCGTPTGFNTLATTTLALANQAGITGLSIDTTNSDANTVVLTRSVSSINSSTAASFDFGSSGGSDGITNPSQGNHTFYARILTFATGAAAQGYTSGTPGTYVDAGGVALSTANQIQITSKVQERLTFCVYTGGSCTADTTGAATTSAIALGNTNGVLDPSGPYVDKSAKFDVSTNAVSGATIVLKGDTLKSGAFDISAIGGSATSSSAGTEQFGMCLYQSTGSGLTLPTAAYNNANCNTTTQTAGTGTTGGAGTAQFGFNTANTTSASGETIATKPAGSSSTATMAFLGNIAFTTEAGIYQTTLTYIATGQY